MKKILIFSFLVLLSVLTANASGGIAVESVTVENGVMTAGFTVSGMEENDWLTLLVYKSDSPQDEDLLSNIVSVKQFRKGDKATIDFALSEIPEGTYQVKMGGEGITAPSVMSVTIDSGMSENIRFVNTFMNMFIGNVSDSVIIKDEKGNPVEFASGNKYIAVTSGAMSLNGYTIKEYGIRLNGKDYKAKVTMNNFNKYGVLFKGEAVKDGFEAVAFPYAVYSKEGCEDVTCYGNSIVRTVGDNDNFTAVDSDTEITVPEISEEECYFYDDFSELSVLPTGYAVGSTAYGTVTVSDYEAEGKNCLTVEDNVSDSVGALKYAGVGVRRSFDAVREKFALELKMKFKEKSNSFMSATLSVNAGSNSIIRFLVSSSEGNLLTTSEIGETASLGILVPDVWYTLRFVLTPGEDTFQMRVVCPETGLDKSYTSLGCNTPEGVTAGYADNIYFDTQVFDGAYIFDYIRLEKNPDDLPEEVFVHPDDLIEPPLVSAPVPRAVEGKINIYMNGEYLYPASPLYEEGEEVMIYLKNAANVFGGEYSPEGYLKLYGNEMYFTGDSDAVICNGSEIKLAASAVMKEDKLYIPLLSVMKSIGIDAVYSEEEKTVILKKEAD